MNKDQQTTIYLHPETKKKLRIRAFNNGTSMRKIIEKLIEKYLKTEEPATAKHEE